MVFKAVVLGKIRHSDESYSRYECQLLNDGWGQGIGDSHKVKPNLQIDKDGYFYFLAAKKLYDLGDTFEISFRRTGNVDNEGT